MTNISVVSLRVYTKTWGGEYLFKSHEHSGLAEGNLLQTEPYLIQEESVSYFAPDVASRVIPNCMHLCGTTGINVIRTHA